MEEAFVYMVTNDRGNVLYTGCTQNLKERVYFHKKGMIPGFLERKLNQDLLEIMLARLCQDYNEYL